MESEGKEVCESTVGPYLLNPEETRKRLIYKTGLIHDNERFKGGVISRRILTILISFFVKGIEKEGLKPVRII